MIEVNAKSLLLDVLRSTNSTAWPAKKLIEVADMFSIKESAVRVTLSRLVSRGLIETSEHGSYLMKRSYDPVRNWIDSWKKGEERISDWNGYWLCIYPPAKIRKKDRLKLDKAAHRLGFRSVQDRMWARPDNLTMPLERMNELLEAMSGVSNLVYATVVKLHADDQDLMLERLWNRSDLEKEYRQCAKRLKRCMLQKKNLHRLAALKESILVGGQAIRLLALDPLLPGCMIDKNLRVELNTTTHNYNDMYHESWKVFLDSESIERVPINLNIEAMSSHSLDAPQ
ncbi:MAG TPA: hypothetical protein EYQ44_08865 [Porticoccaceae bacterium]|nr:hypothetical protein [Porticoccaceae bacterium]